MEFDFGEIQVDFPEGRRKVLVLIGTWVHSYAAFAIALPTQRTEAILYGMIAAFEHFGCVPKEVWWDNPKTVAVQILHGRDRQLNELYMALASHYNFIHLLCMPARRNEQPHVENRVKWLEREQATLVPSLADMEALNAYLRQRCHEDRQRMVTGLCSDISKHRRRQFEVPVEGTGESARGKSQPIASTRVKMIQDGPARRLQRLLSRGMSLGVAALKSRMSENVSWYPKPGHSGAPQDQPADWFEKQGAGDREVVQRDAWE